MTNASILEIIHSRLEKVVLPWLLDQMTLCYNTWIDAKEQAKQQNKQEDEEKAKHQNKNEDEDKEKGTAKEKDKDKEKENNTIEIRSLGHAMSVWNEMQDDDDYVKKWFLNTREGWHASDEILGLLLKEILAMNFNVDDIIKETSEYQFNVFTYVRDLVEAEYMSELELLTQAKDSSIAKIQSDKINKSLLKRQLSVIEDDFTSKKSELDELYLIGAPQAKMFTFSTKIPIMRKIYQMVGNEKAFMYFQLFLQAFSWVDFDANDETLMLAMLTNLSVMDKDEWCDMYKWYTDQFRAPFGKDDPDPKLVPPKDPGVKKKPRTFDMQKVKIFF